MIGAEEFYYCQSLRMSLIHFSKFGFVTYEGKGGVCSTMGAVIVVDPFHV